MTIPFRPVARSPSGSTGGEKAEMARRGRRSRRTRRIRGSRRGGVVLRGKITNPCLPPQRASLRTAVRERKVRESLSSPFALPRAAAAAPAAPAAPARARPPRPARNRWLESAFPLFPPGNRACGRPCTTRRSRMRPSPPGQRRPAERCPPGGVVHIGKLRKCPFTILPMCDMAPGTKTRRADRIVALGILRTCGRLAQG